MDFIITKVATKLKSNKLLSVVFLSNVLISFHYSLLIYINSSFLSNFFSPPQISVLYIIGSGLDLLLLINISKALRWIGNYRLISYLILLEIVSAIGLAFSVNKNLIALYFVLYQVCIPAILFCLDLFLEDNSPNEGKTGQIRSVYLTLANLTVIGATLVVSWVLTDGDYYKIYLTSLVFIIPLYYLLKKYFSNFQDGILENMHIKQTFLTYLRNKDLEGVHAVHFCLQIFYAYMVIYMPVYLSKFIGFSWAEIGLIFTIMLLPFILFEVPVGWLADKKWGEQEMMTIGLIIMGVFTLCASFITTKNFVLWASILFLTRIGASLVEATTNSYFFKKVNKDNADVIAFYRMSEPASFIIAPVLATLSLTFLSYNHIFIILGLLMLGGCYYSLLITDTR